MYKKFRTTVHANGETKVVQMGTTAATNLDKDMETEHRRFSRLAMIGGILSVDVTDATVVAVYKDGAVRIVHWVLTL